MSYTNWISESFGLVFLAIVMSGFFLSFSMKLALVSLTVAFSMNFILFAICAYKSFKGDVDQEFGVHP